MDLIGHDCRRDAADRIEMKGVVYSVRDRSTHI